MTVKDLFDHIQNIPNKIVYFDKTNNVEDVIEILVRAVDEIRYMSYDSYYDFIDEYGDKEVTDWDLLWLDDELRVEVDFK